MAQHPKFPKFNLTVNYTILIYGMTIA